MSDQFRDDQSDRDRFGRDVADAIRARDLISEAEYLSDDFTVRCLRLGDTEPGICHLTSAYRAFGNAPDPERRDRISAFAAVADHGGAPDDFETARPMLRCVIRPADYVLKPGDPHEAIQRPFVPYLVECAVLDSPTAMAYVSHARLDTWGVTAEEVFDQARSNLATTALSLMGVPAPPDRNTLSVIEDDGDHYTSSLPLIPGWLEGFGRILGGWPVVFLAEHTVMYVAVGVDDAEALTSIVEAVGRHYTEAVRPISPVPLTVDNAGNVVPFAVDPGHPAAAALNQARIALAMRVYGGQTQVLQQAHPDRDNTHFAELIAVSLPEGCESTLVAVAHGLAEASLLPEADLVAVLLEGAEELLIVPFAAAADILVFAAVDGYYPPRYRMQGVLDADAIEKLRAHAVPVPSRSEP